MSKQAKILIVDDDPVFVDSTKAVLESKNYQVTSAGDGDEGIRKAAEVRPDLIILDVIMPTKDGFTACEQLKKDPRFSDTPVIILTSFAEKRGESNIPVSAGLSLEAEAYVDKPVAPQKLLDTVAKLLARASSH
ncbi:MAG: response regulator [Chloroflexi bacterium]|nr:response regulator [Chloroflexota bacterium]